MKKLKILQIASFNGNIGDIANHNGFRHSLKKAGIIGDFTNLEIRNFYKSWNKNKFDKAFAEIINNYDAAVFGGGDSLN